MISSMTGYGWAKDVAGGVSITAELRSVNNRYLDCSVRLPRNYLFAEETVKSAVKEHITRGKVDVFITIESSGADDVEVSVNDSLASGYISALCRIAEKFGAPNEYNTISIAKFPEVLHVEKKEIDKDSMASAIGSTLKKARGVFDEMRNREGGKLKEDVLNRLRLIEDYVSAVEERSPKTVAEYREKLFKKMQEVLQNTALDEQRILTEAAIFADKSAVDEETVRLRSHISQMREMLEQGSPIGRKMDFLIQEFNRESNTIGSKCNDGEIAKIVIELKSEIEKIREQIQNIE